MNLPDFSAYYLHLLQHGRKKRTAYRHLNLLKILLPQINSLSTEEINRILLKYKLDGKRHSYINHILDSLRLYAEYQGIKIDRIKRFGRESFAKATMSDGEIEEFLQLPCPKVPWNKGNGKIIYRYTDRKGWEIYKMFFTICAFTGMRMGEVAGLKVNDVDFGRGVFILGDTKTNTPRSVPISSNIEEPLRNFMADLKSDYLFPSRRGGHSIGDGKPVLDSVDWQKNFQTRIDILGIKRTNLTPYSLRHSLITRLLEEDVNLFKIQKIVGHKRISTTAQYEHLTTKDIKFALEKDRLGRTHKSPRLLLQALLDAVTKLFDRDQRFERTVEDKGDEIVIRIKIKELTKE